MGRKREHAPYTPRQGYIDERTHRFVSRPVVRLEAVPAEPVGLTSIQKAQAARALNAAIKRGEHQTEPAAIQRVYDIAHKLGILEEQRTFDPTYGATEAWIDTSDNTLHETVE
jgi:hypothetical protein